MSDKPKLIPIPPPVDPEADRGDLSKPFPIEYGGRWYAVYESYIKAGDALIKAEITSDIFLNI